MNIEKATRSGNFEQAENQITQRYHTTNAFRIKAEFIRLMVWLLLARG